MGQVGYVGDKYKKTLMEKNCEEYYMYMRTIIFVFLEFSLEESNQEVQYEQRIYIAPEAIEC
jgi:hypothetical protein